MNSVSDRAFAEAQVRRRRRLLTLLSILLLAYGARLYRLDAPALRGDEAFSVLFSRQSAGDMVSAFTAATEPHPPLSFLVLHLWGRLAGETEFALRFTSVFAGTLTVALSFVLGRLLWEKEVGLTAAALVALNPFQIWHAQEARMYAMAVTLSLASSILFLTVLKQKGWFWSGAYGLIAALSVYTHYYAFLVLLAQGTYALVSLVVGRGAHLGIEISTRTFRRWAAGLALGGLLYLPWLLSSWQVMTAYRGSARSGIPLWRPVYRSLLTFAQGQTLPDTLALWSLPFWGALFLIGWLVGWHRRRASTLFLALYFSVPWIAVFVDSLRRPAFDERYFILSSPPFYVLVSLSLVAMWGWRARLNTARALTVAVGGFVLCMYAISLYHHYHDPAFARAPDWRALNQFFVRRTRPGDVVVANYPDPAIRYYYQFDAPWLLLPAAYPVDLRATEAAIAELTQVHSRVWFTPQRWPSWDAEGLVQQRLDALAEKAGEFQVDSFKVLLYYTPKQYTQDMVPLEAWLEGRVRLLGYTLRDSEGHSVDRLDVAPGGEVRLTLYWRAEAQLQEDYVVFAHLLDAAGQLRGQQDNQPRQGTFPTRAWKPGDWVVDVYAIPVAPETPHGPGVLEIGMYRPDNGVRLALTGSDGDPLQRRVLLRDVIWIR